MVSRDFSGYIAADELYDGPFCVLYIVNKRIEQRVALDMLRDDPSGTRDQTTVTLHRAREG